MSLFKKAKSGDISDGVRSAVADALSSQFGSDGDLGDFEDFEDDESMGSLELDDEEIDAELYDIFLGDDDEDDDADDDEEVVGPHSSRVALANEVRFGGKGFAARQAKRSGHLGIRSQKRTMAGPKIWGQLGELATASQGFAPLFIDQSGASAPVAGVPWWQQHVIAAAPQPAPQPASSLASTAAVSVEAGVESLPPTYVVDQVQAQAEPGVAPVPVSPSVAFGSTADGLIHRQRRPRAKRGVQNAVARSTQALAQVPYGPKSALVEDPGSSPILLSDGRILDEVYGELLAVPCPSCSHMTRQAAYAGLGNDCCACDGFGAILIPQADVPSYFSTESYGFLPLLIPLVAAGAPLVAGGIGAGNAKEERSTEERKHSVMQRLLAKRQKIEDAKAAKAKEKEASKIESGAAAVESAVPSEAESEIDDLFKDLESDLDDDEYGVDAWAQDVFGGDDQNDFDEIDDELEEIEDEEDFDKEASSDETFGLVRVMIPSEWE